MSLVVVFPNTWMAYTASSAAMAFNVLDVAAGSKQSPAQVPGPSSSIHVALAQRRRADLVGGSVFVYPWRGEGLGFSHVTFDSIAPTYLVDSSCFYFGRG
jgi:hypothetical protein